MIVSNPRFRHGFWRYCSGDSKGIDPDRLSAPFSIAELCSIFEIFKAGAGIITTSDVGGGSNIAFNKLITPNIRGYHHCNR